MDKRNVQMAVFPCKAEGQFVVSSRTPLGRFYLVSYVGHPGGLALTHCTCDWSRQNPYGQPCAHRRIARHLREEALTNNVATGSLADIPEPVLPVEPPDEDPFDRICGPRRQP